MSFSIFICMGKSQRLSTQNIGDSEVQCENAFFSNPLKVTIIGPHGASGRGDHLSCHLSGITEA